MSRRYSRPVVAVAAEMLFAEQLPESGRSLNRPQSSDNAAWWGKLLYKNGSLRSLLRMRPNGRAQFFGAAK
jgi:hypothetical protein